VPHQIIGIFMECATKNATVVLSTEHDRYEWINPDRRHGFVMMEPDCYVVDTFAKRD
jgi:hypothetical protein